MIHSAIHLRNAYLSGSIIGSKVPAIYGVSNDKELQEEHTMYSILRLSIDARIDLFLDLGNLAWWRSLVSHSNFWTVGRMDGWDVHHTTSITGRRNEGKMRVRREHVAQDANLSTNALDVLCRELQCKEARDHY